MAILHISEAEAIRDFASLLKQVRGGCEVIIDGEESSIRMTASQSHVIEEPEPGYNAWFCEQVQEALDDARPSLSSEAVEECFAKRRQALEERLAVGTR